MKPAKKLPETITEYTTNLCLLLLMLLSFSVHADVVFEEGFESGQDGWSISNGVWEVGEGSCYSGSQCAGTVLAGNYPPNDDSRLISPLIDIPFVGANEELHLRFQQWFSYAGGDYGQVQISVQDELTGAWLDECWHQYCQHFRLVAERCRTHSLCG